jgi:hypothetical protein
MFSLPTGVTIDERCARVIKDKDRFIGAAIYLSHRK